MIASSLINYRIFSFKQSERLIINSMSSIASGRFLVYAKVYIQRFSFDLGRFFFVNKWRGLICIVMMFSFLVGVLWHCLIFHIIVTLTFCLVLFILKKTLIFQSKLLRIIFWIKVWIVCIFKRAIVQFIVD